MKGQPEPNYLLAVPTSPAYEGVLMETKDALPMQLLEALIEAWLVNESPREIGSDVNKIRLLQKAQAEIGGPASDLVRSFYREVFLKDVWSTQGHG